MTSDEKSPLAKAIGALPLRNIGPAFMGGRIADIAVHPTRTSTWYVAVGSGGVWKTINAGTTWTPIFDEEASYSIGCIAIDPNQPDVIWVGSGEAVSGRHVGWGDGVYRSRDGGKSWQNMGLARSEHIGQILIDPRDSNVVYVAAEGPLWSAGGDRGVYKTIDGGESWQPVLQLDADTGVTKIEFAPDDPDVVYAAAYQRRRRVWSFLGGGAGSGIHKSTNGGKTWRRMTEGLPEGDMGKIGLAVSPAAPDTLYATIEADEETRGFYRSTDRGESWERRNKYLSGGTGPHYYQEIFASPTNADRVYQVDVFVHWTPDGGTTINRLETGKTKHSDNHVVWIDPDDGDHLLIGADAGLYETFDHGESFRHFPNLPISQFYRVAADNSEPFYNVLAGAQDLGTLYGPSRTTTVEGVRNQDWTVTLGADGYHVAFDPDDPSTSYFEWQNGNVLRHDRRTMELQDIKPMPAEGDPPERWNWDCPIVVSHHDSKRIYVASQRVWRCDDRGESWSPISGDLTRDINRYEIPTGDHVESVDALWDHMAMSMYSTITHVSESPVADGVLYAGTDDGLVQSTADGGASWQECAPMPDFPTDGFINNVCASQHDAAAVYVVADAHKNGDYAPYIFESRDHGATWTSISGDLPEGTTVWAIQQDHVNEDLLIAGTEFGLYVTLNRGQNWHRLNGDVPTIAFRDLVLQRRDDDVVGATFGRGIYVLDDYAALREMTEEALSADASLFSVRDAWWYVPHQLAQSEGQPTLGSSAYSAANPDFGATFTYHLAADLLSAKKTRNKAEEPDGDVRVDIDFPGWPALWQEHLEADPQLFLLVRDGDGHPVRRLLAKTTAGLHRTTWDLRVTDAEPPKIEEPGFKEPWESSPKGPLVMPGDYSVELVLVSSAGIETLSESRSFSVRPTPPVAQQPAIQDTAAFWHETWELQRDVLALIKDLADAQKRIKEQRIALAKSAAASDTDFMALESTHADLETTRRTLQGDPVREKLSEPASPSVSELVGRIADHHWDTTQPPTRTQRESLARAKAAFEALDTSVTSRI